MGLFSLRANLPSVRILLNYNGLSKKPSLFQSLTGLKVSEFDNFYTQAVGKYGDCEARRLARPDRKRKVGAGYPFKLPLQERLLMFLIYYRLYITSTLTGVLFDLDQSNVLKDIHKLEQLVKEILPIPSKLHDKARRLQRVEEIEAMFPEFKAFIDATEQEIPRPKDKQKRKTHYSGKKKRHTVKTQLTVNSNGLIIHKTAHAKGSTHDYSLYKRSHPHLPSKVRQGFDLGYVGIKQDFPGLNCVLPFKKKNPGRGKRGVKLQELPEDQKALNKALTRERIVVEHTNSRVKKFLIWGGEFRNRAKRYDVMTDIVSGLINFRILGTLTI
jgi:DDE superfamily endonuclease/Helix-turn-helix of DDE superfamily endonuclease